MACLSSGRLCIRGFEKLCFLSQNTQLKRKSAAYVRIKEIGIQPIARTFVQNCQVSRANFQKYRSSLDLSKIWWCCAFESEYFLFIICIFRYSFVNRSWCVEKFVAPVLPFVLSVGCTMCFKVTDNVVVQ